MSLQREFTILVPLSGVLAITLRGGRWRPGWRSALVGCLFGFACLIKPGALLGLPVVYWFLVVDNRIQRNKAVWMSLLTIGLPSKFKFYRLPALFTILIYVLQ